LRIADWDCRIGETLPKKLRDTSLTPHTPLPQAPNGHLQSAIRNPQSEIGKSAIRNRQIRNPQSAIGSCLLRADSFK